MFSPCSRGFPPVTPVSSHFQKKSGSNNMADNLLLIISFLLVAVATQDLSSPLQAKLLKQPHFTGCISRDLETFSCWWDPGSLTEPGELRVFFMQNASPKELRECPHYSYVKGNECFFNKSYTSVWIPYRIQLHSQAQDIIFDEISFNVENIVHPDPPVGLNWTLLNVGLTGMHADVLVSWRPPPLADVQMGWMTLEYEVQYQERNSSKWSKLDLEKSTQQSIYGLRTNTDYEFRVRCKMLAFSNFGEFSNSTLIHIPTKESRFPIALVLIFAALTVAVILMLIIISQQHKLIGILLPTIPEPKIKGIDQDLLKRGKLSELSAILSDHHNLRPELYNEDPLVEFIELDIDQENERLNTSDMRCLVDQSPSSDCPHLTIGFKDDDSGRASCCDQDLPDSETILFQTFLSNTRVSFDSSSPAKTEPGLSFVTSSPEESKSHKKALYAQVSEVNLAGEVLLSPEQKREPCNNPDRKFEEREKEKKEFQLLLINHDGGGYTSELDAGKISAKLSHRKPSELALAPPEERNWVQCQSFGEYQTPPQYPISPLPTAPVYTMVDSVDMQNSLLLKPNSLAHHPAFSKLMPTPEGYLNTDLLENITS